MRNLVLLLLFLMPGVTLGQGLTPLDVARLEVVGTEVEISPDERYVAYTVSEPRDPSSAEFKNGPAQNVLHIYDVKSGRDRIFITDDEKMKSVDWTPDSSHLSFLSKRGDDKETSLYLIPVDGGEARKVLSYGSGIETYSIAPDGRRVAFTATPEVDKEKKKMKEKGFDQEIFEEEWRNDQLFLTTLEADTSDLKPLPVEGHVTHLDWSPRPGDDRILIVKAEDPSVDAELMYRHAFVIDPAGRQLAAIANPGKLGDLAWSPDGKKIALAAGVDINDPDEAILFVADSSSGAMKALSPDIKGRADAFCWKNSDQILAAESLGADSRLVLFSADGKRTDSPSDPNLNYLGVDAAPGGTVAVVADSARFPRELFVNGKRVTDSNPWLKNRRFGEQKVVKFKARDGLELEGILISPIEVSGPAPTILTVHGGPESHYDDGWLTYYSTPGQVAAGQGYAVFYPNYRGSTGRGVEFSKTSQGDPAGKEFDDLIDAIDYLVAQGIADKDKIGVTGGSYGGYATAWLSTRYSDRIAAGVMFVGISDKVSKVGTTDIPDEEYLVHARRRPWEDFDFFAGRSPIRYVEQARTPLLILHGKEDPRVHPTQSMELFRYLKVLGQTPVRLVLYPGEGHGNRKAAARYDFNLRMMRWFDTYLKGKGGEKPPVKVEYGL